MLSCNEKMEEGRVTQSVPFYFTVETLAISVYHKIHTRAYTSSTLKNSLYSIYSQYL